MSVECEDAAVLTEQERDAFVTASCETKDQIAAARLTPASVKWLQPALNTEQGTAQVYELLEQHVQTEQFLQTVQVARQHADAQYWQEAGVCVQMAEVEQQWSHLTALPEPVSAAADQQQPSSSSTEHLGEFVMVQREEVIEAMGAFVAAYLANLPETKKMDPVQLQTALRDAFRELRKSPTRRLWDWSKTLYRAAAVSYAAFKMYENPVVVMALLKGMWLAAKILLGALF